MRGINKNTEPENFKKWKEDYSRLYPDSQCSWKNLKDIDETDTRRAEIVNDFGYIFEKKDLRTSLVTEQGFICCYCCRRIEDNSSTVIEHFRPKDKNQYPELIFDYYNLFASCEGISKETSESEEYRHCDDFKENKYENKKEGLKLISPIDKNDNGFICEQEFLYDQQGKIIPKNNQSNAEFTVQILNLNNPYLVKKRNKAIEFFFDDNGDFFEFNNQEIESLFNEYIQLNYNTKKKRYEYTEYSDIILFFFREYYKVAA